MQMQEEIKSLEQAKPFVGETVIFVQSVGDQKVNGTAEHPAIVTRVWNDHMVNLKVMFDCGPTESIGSVIHDDMAMAGAPRWYRPCVYVGAVAGSQCN